MASGETHDRLCSAVATLGMVGTPFLSYGYLEFGFFLGAGIALSSWAGGTAGILLSPDLDLVNKDGNGCSAVNIWKSVGLGWYWGWYGKLPHHSPLSHWPVLSTALRPVPEFMLYCLASFVATLAVADAVHWIADGAPIGPGTQKKKYLLRL